MPLRPLGELRPHDFPKIGDEENIFDSYDEDTDEAQNEEPENQLNENEENVEVPLMGMQRPRTVNCTIL